MSIIAYISIALFAINGPYSQKRSHIVVVVLARMYTCTYSGVAGMYV